MSPTSIAADLAAAVRLVIFDVDGVMTDGGIYLGATASGDRFEFKRFDISDGLGTRLLRDAGLELAIVTGRISQAVAMRAEELGIPECHQDRGAMKMPVVEDLMERLRIGWGEVAFLGDDLPDLAVMRKVGLPAAVANAVPEVKAVATWVSTRPGGNGAVREFAEALLRARGEWTARVEAYVKARGG